MKILQKNVKFYTNAEFLQIYSTEKIEQFCKNGINIDKSYLQNKGLSEFEIIQISNLKPTQIIDLQLIIEEMEERYSEEDLNDILQFINNY